MMKFFGSWEQKPYLAWTFINVFILFHGGPRVNGQAFTFSRITLSRRTSAVGATLQASCYATYLASTAFVMDWRINDTVVGLYQITDNMVPQLADGSHSYDVVFSTVNTTVHTGDTFEILLEIRNLKLNDDHTAISVTCTNCVHVSTLINVEECQTDNSNGVIASDVVSPCGLGCQVQYSCEIGYEGHNITATCLADATFDEPPSCVQSNIDSNSTLIKLPTNQATIATKVTGLIINSGDILSPNICAWTYTPGLTIGSQFYQSLFGGCKSTTTATYSISCSESSGVVSSNLTILAPLTSNVNVVMKCSPSPTYNLQVIVKDCTSPTPSNVPVNPPTGVYNTPAHFQCSQHSTLFYSSGTIGNTATKCLASAEWENEKIVQCWSAPTATLIGNNTHCVGDKATFQCNAVGGFPLADRVEIYLNGQKQVLNENTWTSTALNSSNNGDIVECRAISKYTSIAEYSHLGKDENTLTVYFPAEQFKVINGLNNVCEWMTGGPQLCSITFTLNPILHSTMLTKDGLIVKNDIGYTQQNTVIQNFLFIRNQPSENETGPYKLTVMSANFEPVDFLFTIIVSQPSQASDQSADSVVIVGSVLASIIFILLITNAFFIYQFCRYRNVKPIAEDRNQGNINSASADYVELDDAMRSNKISQQNMTQQRHSFVNTGASVITNDQSYMDIQAVQPRNTGTSNDGYEVVINRNYENMGGDWKKEGQSQNGI